MKDVITTLIPRYGELNRIYKDWFDNKGFSFEKQKFITKFYLDYNDVTVLETAILELVFHLPQEQYTLILNSLKKEVCENISYYKKGCMPDEQTVYNICFRVSEIYKEAIPEQPYTTPPVFSTCRAIAVAAPPDAQENSSLSLFTVTA